MNEEQLNKRLKVYYYQKKLPQASLENLKKMIEQENHRHATETEGIKFRWQDLLERLRSTQIQKMVAVFSCLLIISLVTVQVFQKDSSNNMLQTAVLKEISMNHSKSLVPEFSGIDIQTLGSLMAKLDFSPVVPDIVTALNLKFQGARYCSIQGNLAVLLNFKTTSGNICTLYQTLSTERLVEIGEMETTSDNVQVKLWHEKGLFMAMAGPLD